mgnify:CR=1 FL=1
MVGLEEGAPGGENPGRTTGMNPTNNNKPAKYIKLSDDPNPRMALGVIIAYQWLRLHVIKDTSYDHENTVTVMAKIISKSYGIHMPASIVLIALEKDGRFKAKEYNGDWIIKARYSRKVFHAL